MLLKGKLENVMDMPMMIGPTGPTGPTGADGVTANNAHFYLSTTPSIGANTAVPFDSTLIINGSDIALPSSGNISLAGNATYLVNWLIVGTTSGGGLAAGLYLNGILVEGTQVDASSGETMSEANGTAIINTSTSSTLQLVAFSNTQLIIGGGAGAPAGKSAIMSIIRLA